MQIEFSRWSAAHAQQLQKIANNSEVSYFLTDAFPFPYTLMNACNFLQFCDGYRGSNKFFALQFDGHLIGGANIAYGVGIGRRSASVGYWLGRDFWGKGIGTAVVQQLCQMAFSNPEIIRVDAEIFAENKPSKRVLEKCGFKREGVLKKAIFKHGKVFDKEVYAIVRK